MIHLADLVGCLGLKQIRRWNNSNSGSTEQLVLIVSEVEQLAVTTGLHSITQRERGVGGVGGDQATRERSSRQNFHPATQEE